MTREQMEEMAEEYGLNSLATKDLVRDLQCAYEAGVMFYARRGYQQGRESMREEAARVADDQWVKLGSALGSRIRAIPIEGES